MRFGGLQKTSLIDYPGKISCVFFLSGCNFDCPYCHNAELVNDNPIYCESLDDTEVDDFLKHHRGLIDGVVISGGEPTLQEDLAIFCEKIKKLGYSVKLDTNGSKPNVLKKLLDYGLVDYIAMDIKTDPLHYDPIIKKGCNPDNVLSSIRLIMESGPAYEFRTTSVKGLVDEDNIFTILQIIKDAERYALQPFQNNNVLHPEFFQDMESNYSNNELLHLKSIAEPWVKECVIH